MPEKPPGRTTMPGMIWVADKVLDRALDPTTRGVRRDLFENCKGIVLLSSIEAGFTFTGKLGTGIFVAKKRDGSWSVPCAIGVTTVGTFFISRTHRVDGVKYKRSFNIMILISLSQLRLGFRYRGINEREHDLCYGPKNIGGSRCKQRAEDWSPSRVGLRKMGKIL